MFCFCRSKTPSNIIKNSFDSIFLYILKKHSVLTNIRSKYLMRNINLSFLALWKMAKLFLQMFVIFNMITDSFLVKKGGTLEHARKYVYKNFIFIVRIVFVLVFIELLINKESFGKSFSFSFAAKYFDRNFKYFFEKLSNFLYIVLCHFLISWRLEDSKHIKRYIFHYFL